MKYKTILADPPWSYRNQKTGRKCLHGASQKYSVMSTDNICDLSIIPKIQADDSVLFLWATAPCLPDAFRVMEAWGYEYKAQLIWIKTASFGMGFWFRVQYEICLIGKRGRVKPFGVQSPNIFFAARTIHSKKPERFFQMVDPVILRPAIELFARQRREGWDAWGDEIEEGNFPELPLVSNPVKCSDLPDQQSYNNSPNI